MEANDCAENVANSTRLKFGTIPEIKKCGGRDEDHRASWPTTSLKEPIAAGRERLNNELQGHFKFTQSAAFSARPSHPPLTSMNSSKDTQHPYLCLAVTLSRSLEDQPRKESGPSVSSCCRWKFWIDCRWRGRSPSYAYYNPIERPDFSIRINRILKTPRDNPRRLELLSVMIGDQAMASLTRYDLRPCPLPSTL